MSTFNPIIEEVVPSPVRLLDRLKSPAMDTALVLEPVRGELVLVRSGELVPGRFVGRYRRAVLVDLKTYQLVYTDEMPSADPAFTFSAQVVLNCRVVDPVEVMRSGIKNVTTALRPHLAREMHKIVRRFDVADQHAANEALHDHLDLVRGGGGFELSNFHVTLTSSILATHRDIRIEKVRRGAMREVVDGGHPELIAQHLLTNDNDPTSLLAAEAEAADRDKDRMVDVLRISSEDDTDPVDSREVKRRAFGKILGDPAMLKGTTEGRRRLSRREHLAATRGEASPAELGAPPEAAPPAVAPPAAEPAAAEPAEPPRRVSRLRGSAVDRPRDGGGL